MTATPIPTATTAAVNFTSTAFYNEVIMANSDTLSLQFIAASLDQADGVIKLQDSNDNSNWNDISGATITVASGTSSNMIRYTSFASAFIRCVWTKGTNTTGTITAIANINEVK